MKKINAYCSWCFRRTEHHLTDECLVSRNIHMCSKCKNFTLICRAPACTHMAKGQPNLEARKEEARWHEKFRERWNSEFCAVHDGTIASFERLRMRLSELEDFSDVFTRDGRDLVKTGKIVAATAGGAIIAVPLTLAAAPAAAATLGSLGALGAAGTGTAISTLHGAALTSASLAAIGGGTMTGGAVVISAVGGALGAAQGAVVGNSYFGQIRDFNITKWNEGDGPAVIFINGFLQQNVFDPRDWRRGLRGSLSHNPWYHVAWESKTLSSFWGKTFKNGSAGSASKFAAKYAARAAKKAAGGFSPLTWAAFAADLVGNPWHVAMAKASMTGVLLADLVARTQKQDFILMGHSLGARVVYYTLQALSTKRKKFVRDVYLFGGAVGQKDDVGWNTATEAVSGKIYNCYSSGDKILKALYRGANAFLSDPVGLGPISCESPAIENHDFSRLIHGHMEWKQKLGRVLHRLPVDVATGTSATEERKNAVASSRCAAITRRGKRCSRAAVVNGFCSQHAKQKKSAA